MGCAAAALTLVVASVLGWIGRGDHPPLRSASPGRLAALAVPAVLGFLLAGDALEFSRRTRDVVIEVVTAREPAAPSEEAPPSGGTAASVADISRRVALGLMTGILGVPDRVDAAAGRAVDRRDLRLSHACPRRHERSYRRLNLTVTVMITGTGTPFSSVGEYSHCRTASTAA